jgi:hypothetical protein
MLLAAVVVALVPPLAVVIVDALAPPASVPLVPPESVSLAESEVAAPPLDTLFPPDPSLPPALSEVFPSPPVFSPFPPQATTQLSAMACRSRDCLVC